MVYNAGDEKLIASRDPDCRRTTVRWVEVEKINVDDKRFQVTTRAELDSLTASIQQVGLLHPLLLADPSEGYIIVSGFRRMAACRQLGWQHVPAMVLTPQTGLPECIEVAITENCLQRPLNLIETARSLAMLAGQNCDPSHLAASAAKLGLPGNAAMIAKLIKVSELPGPIQNGILDNTISLAMALELGQLNAEIGIVIAALFAELKVGLNRQRELILLLKEISLRESISITDVLNADEAAAILNAKDLDRSIKNQRLRSYLRQRRYPSIMRAEKNFETHLKELQLGKGLTLTPPREFEGSMYHLSLAFEKRSELASFLSKLDEIVNHPSLKKILERGL